MACALTTGLNQYGYYDAAVSPVLNRGVITMAAPASSAAQTPIVISSTNGQQYQQQQQQQATSPVVITARQQFPTPSPNVADGLLRILFWIIVIIIAVAVIIGLISIVLGAFNPRMKESFFESFGRGLYRGGPAWGQKKYQQKHYTYDHARHGYPAYSAVISSCF